jgi:catechol 2,3-dioxygenase-like lactoylglutathione lyase family enzyme
MVFNACKRQSEEPVNFKLELVTVPVADVDRAKAFYVNRAGFSVEQDVQVDEHHRFVARLAVLDRTPTPRTPSSVTAASRSPTFSPFLGAASGSSRIPMATAGQFTSLPMPRSRRLDAAGCTS